MDAGSILIAGFYVRQETSNRLPGPSFLFLRLQYNNISVQPI